MSILANRYEFVLLFDVENGNPNGNPDADNQPRFDPETERGLITDVCLKRKVRNYITITKGGLKPNDIYVQENAVLTDYREKAFDAVGADKKKDSKTPNPGAKAWMLENYYDIRAFGAVMSLSECNCGQVRGPVQFTFSRSIDPIQLMDMTITSVAEQSNQGKSSRIGHKHIVPYGLYRLEGFISAHLAGQTGFSEEDLALLWEALINMFEHDRSAARGKMCARKLFVFKHDNAIGKAPAQTLFKRVSVARNNPSSPARAFEDYTVQFDKAPVPGVELMEML